jgi:hypothetical protein
MTNLEAKFVLSAYRANGSDAADPAMRDALQQAQRDPSLEAWFEQEHAHAAAVAARLREITPPAGLRDAILAGARAGKTAAPSRSRFWQRPLILAAAASVAVLLSVFSWWRFSPVHGNSLDDFALNFVARGFVLAERSADVGQLKTWLAAHRSPLPAELPASFDRLRALGCRNLKFDGRDVSLVCFESGGKEYHVFVARREDFPGRGPAQIAPAFDPSRRLVATAWSDANNHYVMVSDASVEDVKRLL